MVEVFSPSGASYHQPPYTDEEVRDLNRRVSGIVAFTRPGGQRAAAPGDSGSGPEQGPVQRLGERGDPGTGGRDPGPEETGRETCNGEGRPALRLHLPPAALYRRGGRRPVPPDVEHRVIHTPGRAEGGGGGDVRRCGERTGARPGGSRPRPGAAMSTPQVLNPAGYPARTTGIDAGLDYVCR